MGSFDPIHIGHLHIASAAINANLVEKVLFIPAMQNPWKVNSKSTKYTHRLNMIELAVKNVPEFVVSDIETQIPEPYYSSYTLELLKEQYPNDDLYLIVGADVGVDIKNWFRGTWIVQNFKVIIIAREGFEDTFVFDINKTINVSSTEIRNLCKENKRLYPLVPKEIEEYIKKFNLYS